MMTPILRSHYYLSECGEIQIGMVLTELEPEQFDDKLDWAYEIACPFNVGTHTTHVMEPVTKDEYEVWADAEGDAWDVTPNDQVNPGDGKSA